MSGAPSEPLDRSAREKLCRVLDLLADERASISSVTERGEAWRTHVDDSLTGLVVPELGAARRLVDVGAGAGFPGIPLAVALPSAEVDLVESVARKCEFMTRALEAAGIENARVLNTRSEELASGTGREAYDVVTARAVGRLSTLAELASPLLGDGGVLVAWKGRRDQDEEEQLQRAAASLAMREEGIVEVGFHAASRHRHLHVMRKVGRTPEGLPRRPGMAKKRPRG